MTTLTLAQAQTIVTATLAKGREMGLKPICVAVLDRGGHLIVLQREDGASNLRPQIAMAKASGALGLGVSSRTIGEMAAERPTFVASLASLTGAEIIPAAGGLLIKVGDELVGAVGVTGDTSDNDEACAAAGIAAAGL
ncbi:heme-binding protein [Novosphingobium sp. MW5]|nr:heme-binding protein [Novosphingobium sp. MW5]